MADDELSITQLVTGAVQGDETAWSEIVELQPLTHQRPSAFRLTPVEIEDVAQMVWLRLVEHLDKLREARTFANVDHRDRPP